MKGIPTDLEILNEIYDEYYDAYSAFDSDSGRRETKVFVPIDIRAIAARLKTDPDIVFGRLYYHLERKYGYLQEDGSRVALFTLGAGKDTNCVHFPLAASVLADLREQRRRFSIGMWIAVVSLLVSVTSLILVSLK